MSAAEREAERRWPKWTRHGAGSSSWGDGARERAAFVAGAEWQAEQDADLRAERDAAREAPALTHERKR